MAHRCDILQCLHHGTQVWHSTVSASWHTGATFYSVCIMAHRCDILQRLHHGTQVRHSTASASWHTDATFYSVCVRIMAHRCDILQRPHHGTQVRHSTASASWHTGECQHLHHGTQVWHSTVSASWHTGATFYSVCIMAHRCDILQHLHQSKIIRNSGFSVSAPYDPTRVAWALTLNLRSSTHPATTTLLRPYNNV